jgi:processive 1,2-diacylglycerol beta-glucosyltransferase
VPCATLITDFDPHPGWLHPDLDANLAVGHDVPGVALIRPPVCGFEPSPGARERVRAELGIPVASKVVLIVGGAWGVGNLEGAARAIDSLPGFHAIVVTGKNEGLRKHMAADRRFSHTSVLGYTDRMPDLMAASDVLIQNAGGVTCLEAFSTGLPVVMFDPLPGHGEDNSRHMANEGTIVLADGEEGLRRLLLDEHYWNVTVQHTTEAASALFERPCAGSHLEDLSVRQRSWIARRRAISVAFASFVLMGWLVTEHSPLDFGIVGLLPSHVLR